MKAPALSCFLFLLLNSPAAEAGGVKGRSLKTTTRRQQRHLKGSKSSKSSSKKQVGPTRRDCTTKSSKSSKKGGGSSGLQFECVTRGEGIDDKIKFNVVPSQDNDSLTISVEYKQKGDDVDDLETEDEIETEIKTSYGITFEKIIEYRQPADILIVDDPSEESQSSVAVTRAIDDQLETDNTTTTTQEEDEEEEVNPNNLAFNWENDEIVQTIDLGDWEEFSDIEDDGSIIQFSITSLEGHAKFYFTIAMDADDNNDDLSVNKMKIDFELTNFPWIAEDSYVALVSSVTSGQKIKVLSDEDDDEQLSSPSKKGHHHAVTTKKEVQISFNDAAGVMDFLPFGDYTWKEEAVALPRDLVLNNGNETVDMENNVTTAQTRSADTTTIQVVATSPTSIEPDSEDNSEVATAVNQQQNNGENDFNSNQIIAFSFVGKPAQKAENIYWDPSVGVGYSDDSAASSNNKNSSAAMVSLVSLVTMVFPLVLSFF